MLLKLKDAAEEIGISIQHAKKLVKQGQWPHYRISERVVMIDLDEIKRLTRVDTGSEREEM